MNKYFFTSISSLVILSAPLFSQVPGISGSDLKGSPVVAVVDGAPITLAEFERQRPTALFQARNTFYDTERKAIDEYLDEYLLQRQAKKENLTVPQLLEKHVNSTIAKDPDPESLRLYFEGLDTAETFEAVRPKIVDHIRERRINKAKAAYMQELHSQAKINIQVTPPRVQITMDKTPVRGPAGAPLTLVEFADYECPYCQQIQPDLDRLEKEYKGKIAFAYKDVPLPMHAHAQKAAEAAHCAGVQNKYWEFHDLMLQTKQLEVPQLKAGAVSLGLDTKAFDSCLDSGAQASLVKAQLNEAQTLGLQGTPSFFLNGRFFSGSMSYDQLRQMVEDELKTASLSPAETARR